MKIITRKEAIANGLKYYFTGKPCKHGHLSKRRVTSCNCYTCHRIREEGINWKKYKGTREDWKRRNPKKFWCIKCYSTAKIASKRKGLPFDLKSSKDLYGLLVENCPILGIKLDYSYATPRANNTPSLDRIIPEEGYVLKNIQVVSWRANQLKSNAKTEEVRALLQWMEENIEKEKN